jgi:FG-GAP-like repeat/Bacterial Ig-like domain (group 3)/FG-GAP repeat
MGRVRSILLCLVFMLSCAIFAGAQSFSRTAVSDVTGDGKPDVLILDPTANTVAVYLNTGSGTLGSGAFFGFLPGGGSMVVSDRNGDGIPDILILDSGQTQTLFGDGKGNFSVPSVTPIPPITSSSNVLYADLNGDGLPDLAFGNPVQFNGTTPSTPPTISLMFADGHGGFLPPSALTVAYNTFDIGIGPTSLLVADVNNDGKADLIIGDGQRSPIVFLGTPYLALNDGTGNFKIVPLEENFTIAAAGDLNGDGNLDFMLGTIDLGPTILFGDGHGGILFSRRHSFPGNPGFPVDFDRSGTLDLLVGTTFLPGNGHGDFGDPISFDPSRTASIIAVTDMDGDGQPDLVLNTNPPSIVLNNTVALPVTASTSIVEFVSAANTNIGQPVTFAAVAESNGGTPVGTVTFDNGGTLVSVPLNVYGWASFDTTFNSSGTQSGTASFVGSTDPATATTFGNSSSPNPASTLVLNSPPLLPAPTVSFNISPNPARELNPVTLTPAVSSASGTPTGFVVFHADGAVIGIADVGSSTTVVFPDPGLHNITATYGGDGTFPSATSASIVEDIRALNAVRTATTTQLAITAPTFPSTAFSFLASLQGVNNPSANFIYRVNGAVLAVLPAGKPATFAVPTPGITFTVSAEYQGDAAFLPSITSTSFVLNPPGPEFTLTSSASTLTAKAGQSPIYNITLTPFNGFAETTTFACSGLPAGAACSFNPASITTDSTQRSLGTALTLSTTAAAIAVPHQPSNTLPPAALPVFAVLLCGLLWMLALATRSARTRLMIGASTVLLVLIFFVGCGGGSNPGTPTPTPSATPTPTATPSPSPTPTPSQPTPPGTYNFTVTATSATVTHTISLTVVVQ